MNLDYFFVGLIFTLCGGVYLLKTKYYRLQKDIKKLEYVIQQRCDCKYSRHCRPPRQHLQCIFRIDNLYKDVENCDFYKLIVERNKEVTNDK